VKLAHGKGIQVVLVGPSSILLAMMASGMNEQTSFTFHGYLPIEKTKSELKTLKISFEQNQSQFSLKRPIATINYWRTCYKPYIQKHLCITNILPTEYIKTKKIAAWKRNY
jgi:16S rRNA (cytidine1402-2'-O)-methyltransferase